MEIRSGGKVAAQKSLPVKITAADGFELSGYYFEQPQAMASVLVCCATAVRQRYYFPFASWLCSQGFNVLTLDYRGLGESINAPSLKESKVRKQEWGELDMPAALEWLSVKSNDLPLHLIGHSAGGVLVGLMPNHAKLSSVIAVACSSGYLNKLRIPERFVAMALLKVYFPAATSIFGYLPAKRMGWGEDLPTGVAMQWAEWCGSPGYVRNAFGKDVDKHYYDEVSCPMLFLLMADDPITTPDNVDDFLRLVPKAPIERRIIEPAQFGMKEIGHMGFFRSKNSALWSCVPEWLETHVQPQ